MPVLTCIGQNNLHVQDVYFGVTYFDSGTLQPIVKWGGYKLFLFLLTQNNCYKKIPKFNMKGKSKDIKYDREVVLGTMNSREVYRPWG